MQLAQVGLAAIVGGAKGKVEEGEVKVTNGELKLARYCVAGEIRLEIAVARLMRHGEGRINKHGGDNYEGGAMAPSQ